MLQDKRTGMTEQEGKVTGLLLVPAPRDNLPHPGLCSPSTPESTSPFPWIWAGPRGCRRSRERQRRQQNLRHHVGLASPSVALCVPGMTSFMLPTVSEGWNPGRAHFTTDETGSQSTWVTWPRSRGLGSSGNCI